MADILRKVRKLSSLHFLPLLLLGNAVFCVATAEGQEEHSPSTVVHFGDACNLTKPCDPAQGLACISNICQCDSPSNQRYDNATRKCVSVVGGPCTTSNASDHRKECIRNAHCAEKQDEGGMPYNECECDSGYIENSAGHCVKGIGQPCSYQPDECNPLGMVVCKNGMCQCLDELQVYDVDMQRCVSPAGTHCKYERGTSSLQLGCVKNAICYPFFYWIPPKCLCKPGYVQTKSRQCVNESEYNKSGVDSSAITNHADDGNNAHQSTNPRALDNPWDTSPGAVINKK